MLTLCRVTSPRAIQPPKAPQLKSFKFFTTRSRHSDGVEHLYLHMGYFATLASAQKYAQALRRAYPNAMATKVPAALLRHADSGIPTLRPAATAHITAANAPAGTRSNETSLTDIQVLNILEKRPVQGQADAAVLSDSFAQQLDEALDADRARTEAAAATASAPTSHHLTQTAAPPIASNPVGKSAPVAPRERVQTLEEPVELLAASELWSESASEGNTGPRRS